MTEQIENQKDLYQGSLEDPRWKRLRLQILDRDQHHCKICGNPSNLQVHHRQYHRRKTTGEWLNSWEYHPFFLITVCNSCHFNGHQQFPIPIKEI
jgi:5-methylcytosine-specific restriction endonuclease McrA